MYFCFRNHEHGALNIFNCPNVTVRHCTFRNNTSASYFTRKPYQGNSGGLSLGYNIQLSPLSNVNVLVTECVFINNSADPPSHLFFSSTNLIERKIFSGRGGGMVIPVNVTCPLNIIVNNSLFMNNYASNVGGGLYCYTSTMFGTQTWMLGNNKFISNVAGIGPGALSFANYGTPVPFSRLYITVYNCTFEFNRAQTGGCLGMYPSLRGFSRNFVKIKECLFYNNTSTKSGGAIDITSYEFYYSRQHYNPVQLIDW